MERKFKIGLLLNFDFDAKNLTIVYNWFQIGMSQDLEHNTKQWYFIFLFIGLVVRYER